ncbi:TnsD family Tn7-like transposition protein [Anaerocolumna sp. AGMB13025]|uniref:TnsD family Tn7-like transposition protein n=1 Tax=Anaerocolumna sp. AGMB13025 TaxID=3039116 RepID=UPI00241CCF9E|nr:TnsD family Tn7-like transposition protein [Anaerocolumna sp. AGMB13025]WFR57139.1 TnsD family Tn7-like transposition protein [Anaerocolumna sp. AGMB13025]
MLTFFPEPYPDEFLYSIIARYHVWSGNEELSDTMEELFGNRREKATLLIPKHLKRLAEKTKEFGLDYETLLYEHTIFPFITCFLNKAMFDNALNTINSDLYESTLFIYKHYINPRFLKYCPLCIRDDRDVYGEAYWHRKHQTYGVNMCVKHRCYLMDSRIDISDNRKNRYIALELMDDIKETIKQENISECRVELQIAYDVEYAYENYAYIRRVLCEKHSLVREATISLLFNRELATQKGMVRTKRLREEFKNKYISTNLKQMLVGLEYDRKSDWLITLCRGGQNTVVPIRFILFVNFLAGSLEAYIKLVNEQDEFIKKEKDLFSRPNGYEEKLIYYRKRWLDAWEKNPKGCRFNLVKTDRAAYTWLRRHDNEWMIKNSPQITKPKGTIINKDWDMLDSMLVEMVYEAVNSIKNLEGKPERITKANIGRYMRQKDTIERNYKLLPKTMNKIEQYVESTNEYRLRKIEWAKNEFKREGIPSIPWMILRKAGIRDEDWNKFRYLFYT